MSNLKKKWEDQIKKTFLNKKIVRVEYLSKKEANEMDWYNVPCSFQLDNGVWFYPSRDDEGNDGGSLFTTDKKLNVVPTFSTNDV
mgnify:CR=1 FL=1|tara:strand:- start:216 stop:470 length:255 start_codon:yes stop_codon:yes gene_type:complete